MVVASASSCFKGTPEDETSSFKIEEYQLKISRGLDLILFSWEKEMYME